MTVTGDYACCLLPVIKQLHYPGHITVIIVLRCVCGIWGPQILIFVIYVIFFDVYTPDHFPTAPMHLIPVVNCHFSIFCCFLDLKEQCGSPRPPSSATRPVWKGGCKGSVLCLWPPHCAVLKDPVHHIPTAGCCFRFLCFFTQERGRQFWQPIAATTPQFGSWSEGVTSMTPRSPPSGSCTSK